jgi:hypothetical protein
MHDGLNLAALQRIVSSTMVTIPNFAGVLLHEKETKR